jgi:hypothetical protein
MAESPPTGGLSALTVLVDSVAGAGAGGFFQQARG